MANSKKKEVISIASPHTIKKFELISKYVEAWVEILLVSKKCNGIVYIDCMSNSGVYKKENENGEIIEGTALRVANIIAKAMAKYPSQQAFLYFNDLDADKIDELNTRLPKRTSNFHIQTYSMDANELLRKVSSQFQSIFQGMHFLLIYDPYDANINWEALMPFLRNWGEVIINHMVYDPIRAAKMAKNPKTIEKYERTYQTNIEELVSFGSDRNAFEKKIEQIIRDCCGRDEDRFFIAAFPFFSTTNSVMYNLIHCTGHYKGFELFKSTAWKTFGDRSSMKNTHNNENQLQFNFADDGNVAWDVPTDDACYTLRDVAAYIQEHFAGQVDVPNDDVWEYLGMHPVFPTRDYKNKIKEALKREFSVKVSRSSMTFYR